MRTIALMFGLFICVLSWAQEPKFYTTVDKNEASPDDVIRVSFVLENASGTRFHPPTFSNFYVVSQGHSSSGGMQVIINGKRMDTEAGQETWTYIVKPRSMGTQNIGPASVYVDGKLLQTETLTIKVTSSPKANNNTRDPDLPNSDMFLRISLNKSEAYVGEQVLLTYKIYTRLGIENYSEPTTTLSGFWKEDISQKRPPVHEEVVNGMSYRTAIVKRTILFPQRSGTLQIPSAEMFADVSVSFFRTQRQTLKSNSLTLKVKDLPPGPPAAFTGAVGDYSLESSINTTETTTDEPITLTVTLKGTGNLSLVDVPKVELPNDFEVYDPKWSDHINTSGGTMEGSKKYEYLIIPRQPGSYKLEPLEMAYFNPRTEKYQTLRTDDYTLNVTKGANYAGSNNKIGNVSKEDIELLGKDIRFIKTEYPASGLLAGNIYGTPLFYTLLGSPFLLLLLLFGWRRRQIEQRSDVEGWKQRKAYTKARKGLQQAEKESIHKKQFYQTASEVMWTYLSERLGISQAEISRDLAGHALENANVDTTTSQRLLEYFDTCEMAAYAPMGSDAEPGNMVEEGLDILRQLEKQVQA